MSWSFEVRSAYANSTRNGSGHYVLGVSTEYTTNNRYTFIGRDKNGRDWSATKAATAATTNPGHVGYGLEFRNLQNCVLIDFGHGALDIGSTLSIYPNLKNPNLKTIQKWDIAGQYFYNAYPPSLRNTLQLHSVSGGSDNTNLIIVIPTNEPIFKAYFYNLPPLFGSQDPYLGNASTWINITSDNTDAVPLTSITEVKAFIKPFIDSGILDSIHNKTIPNGMYSIMTQAIELINKYATIMQLDLDKVKLDINKLKINLTTYGGEYIRHYNAGRGEYDIILEKINVLKQVYK